MNDAFGNPFADMKGCGVRENRSRQYFVTGEEAQKVLDSCPDAQWRLLFALSRFGGLRVPSEPLALRWGDVDWENGRITVHSPKTEHHEGKESRQIPLFPEIRPYLEQVWEQAEPGTEWVITRYRSGNANLRTQFERIVRKADLKPWPKPFQNCRSTRETELAETYPIHVVCSWIGNTAAVAANSLFTTLFVTTLSFVIFVSAFRQGTCRFRVPFGRREIGAGWIEADHNLSIP
ncbi:MAG: site-specific integrase [Thermoguttaceae bacterium]